MATKSKSAKRPSGATTKETPDGKELLILELQEIHNAESQLARAMPRLMKAVDSEQLGKLLEQRLEQGAQLIQDIESALNEMDESPGRKKNVVRSVSGCRVDCGCSEDRRRSPRCCSQKEGVEEYEEEAEVDAETTPSRTRRGTNSERRAPN